MTKILFLDFEFLKFNIEILQYVEKVVNADFYFPPLIKERSNGGEWGGGAL